MSKNLALHHLILLSQHEDSLLLAEKNPKLLLEKDHYGNIPIYYAVAHNSPFVLNFAKIEPNSLMFVHQEDGYTIIHMAISLYLEELAINLAELNPLVLGLRDITDNTPIDLAKKKSLTKTSEKLEELLLSFCKKNNLKV